MIDQWAQQPDVALQQQYRVSCQARDATAAEKAARVGAVLGRIKLVKVHNSKRCSPVFHVARDTTVE